MNGNNDKKIREMLESSEVPQELSPENIKKMLDEKAHAQKRKSIVKTASKITAGAAACAVLSVTGVQLAEHYGDFNRNHNCADIESSNSKTDESSSIALAPNPDNNITPQSSFMNSAEDYGEVYFLLEKAAEEYGDGYFTYTDDMFAGGVIMEDAEEGAMENEDAFNSTNTPSTETTDKGESEDFSQTYNQEENVLEPDIVKTDGEYIYYVSTRYNLNDYNGDPVINIARAEDGKFTSHTTIEVDPEIILAEGLEEDFTTVSLQDMYLYNDMLIVIGTAGTSYTDIVFKEGDSIKSFDHTSNTFVNVYTTGENPELIDSFVREGNYKDARITEEGYLYLIGNSSSAYIGEIEDEEDYDKYIPSYSCGGEYNLVDASCILLPEEGFGERANIDYTIINSIDLNKPGEPVQKDIKAIAGFAGNIYCSGENLYTLSGWDTTAITRFSLKDGTITPAAEGEVKGYIKDQFSVSEYNGYFRVAATCEEWTETIGDMVASNTRTGIDNRVYVLDMDLNTVGSVEGFGEDETIKSVSYSGDMAYVVTYEQTDPLFAIDLSNPEKPVILDEYKLPGYSTYMQQWGEGELLGFGVNADEQGIENGIKLVMFDNSDPENLDETASYICKSDSDDQWIYSFANQERKALLIAPEKNLIGVPVNVGGYTEDEYGQWDYYDSSKYMFFEYTDGEFILKGEIKSDSSRFKRMGTLNRAIYIGGYVYVLSDCEFISADIETMTVRDSVAFEETTSDETESETIPVDNETESMPEIVFLCRKTTPEGESCITFWDREGNYYSCENKVLDLLDIEAFVDEFVNNKDEFTLHEQKCDTEQLESNYEIICELAENDEFELLTPEMLPEVEADIISYYGFYYNEDNEINYVLYHSNECMTPIYANDERANDVFDWYRESIKLDE